MRLTMLAGTAFTLLTATAATAATTLIDFNDLTAPGFSGVYQVFPSSVSNVATSVNGSPFLAVPSASASGGTATYTATNFITSFSFDWGSPDSYNNLVFRDAEGAAVQSLTGTGVSAGNHVYTFDRADRVVSVDFGSSTRAFEVDNVSVTAVPEPASWALMLAGFAMVGWASRRRTTTVAA